MNRRTCTTGHLAKDIAMTWLLNITTNLALEVAYPRKTHNAWSFYSCWNVTGNSLRNDWSVVDAYRHTKGLFSHLKHVRQPTKRYCLGWEGRLQICPHEALSYVNVTERPYPSLPGERCGRQRNSWSINNSGGRSWLHLDRTLTLGSLDLTMPNLTEILKSRCIPFCPHTNSSDKNFLAWIHYHNNHVVFARICEDCPAYAPPDKNGSGYVGHHSCDICGMRVRMSTANQGLQYLEGIHISVHRDMNPPSTKPADPQWIANVTMPLTKQVKIHSLANSES